MVGKGTERRSDAAHGSGTICGVRRAGVPPRSLAARPCCLAAEHTAHSPHLLELLLQLLQLGRLGLLLLPRRLDLSLGLGRLALQLLGRRVRLGLLRPLGVEQGLVLGHGGPQLLDSPRQVLALLELTPGVQLGLLRLQLQQVRLLLLRLDQLLRLVLADRRDAKRAREVGEDAVLHRVALGRQLVHLFLPGLALLLERAQLRQNSLASDVHRLKLILHLGLLGAGQLRVGRGRVKLALGLL